MNLLWVAKLFMSLIAKFFQASLLFLASEPKSNSAWAEYTHTCACPYEYTYLTQSHQKLQKHKMEYTNPLTHFHND